MALDDAKTEYATTSGVVPRAASKGPECNANIMLLDKNNFEALKLALGNFAFVDETDGKLKACGFSFNF